MFTGIVEELGEVVGREVLTDSARLQVRARTVVADLAVAIRWPSTVSASRSPSCPVTGPSPLT